MRAQPVLGTKPPGLFTRTMEGKIPEKLRINADKAREILNHADCLNPDSQTPRLEKLDRLEKRATKPPWMQDPVAGGLAAPPGFAAGVILAAFTGLQGIPGLAALLALGLTGGAMCVAGVPMLIHRHRENKLARFANSVILDHAASPPASGN